MGLNRLRIVNTSRQTTRVAIAYQVPPVTTPAPHDAGSNRSAAGGSPGASTGNRSRTDARSRRGSTSRTRRSFPAHSHGPRGLSPQRSGGGPCSRGRSAWPAPLTWHSRERRRLAVQPMFIGCFFLWEWRPQRDTPVPYRCGVLPTTVDVSECYSARRPVAFHTVVSVC